MSAPLGCQRPLQFQHRYIPSVDYPVSVALLGFLLGVRHAVDPDHVVAVGTIVTRSSSFRRAASVGALWGIGHTLTILLVGGGIIVLRVAISPRVGLAMEFAVAIMLILLGLQNVATARRNENREPSAARPFLVGMVHGMAGSAAVVLLVLATVRDSWWAFAYLLLFGLGTVIGMVIVTAIIAVPASLAVRRVRNARRWLTLASGVASVVLGLLLANELTDSTDGLFSDAPAWTPR
jgi:ABC-type nickel/cobalt efflux system permease component RcnA